MTMYATEQPKLSALGRSGPDGFKRICTFVLLTIKSPLYDASKDYILVRKGERSNVRSLFGSKHDGLAYLDHHCDELWEACEDAYEHLDDDDAADCILGILTRIPGIGVTKAGFIAQIIYGLSGCIDTHNLKRFGLPETTFKLRKGGAHKTRSALVQMYNQFCRKVGGTATLWDDWCAYVSVKDPVNYPTPEYVSKLHLSPLEC